MNTKAGKGEHHVYKIIPESDDNLPLTAQTHYLGVDAVSWFLNKENSWFTNRMASGTIEISLSNGMERYKAALGTFELEGGSRIAPVFDRPVLMDRNYRGGGIGFTASLTAIKKDTVLAGVLKSAASASLGIVAGMVDTAAISGPAQILTTAGSQLINGVNQILSTNSEKHEALFDFNGLEFNITANDIVGPEIYLLFHRGANLDENKLTIRYEGLTTIPTYENKDLEDGAWLLLRLRRSSEYPNVRPWFAKRRSLKSRIKVLVDNVINEFQTKESALKEFKFSESGEGTLLDEFGMLRSIILNDGVITEVQALAFTTEVTSLVVNAKKAIKQANKEIIASSEKAMMDMFKGVKKSTHFGNIINDQIYAIQEARSNSLIDVKSSLNLDSLDNISKAMPLTFEEIMK